MNNPDKNQQIQKLPELTPEMMEEEYEIERRRIAFLDSALASLQDSQREKLMSNLLQLAAETIQGLNQKLSKTQEILLPPTGRIQIRLQIMNAEEAKWHDGRENRRIAAATASRATNTISLLNHLALAPKEVIRRMVTHECLHLSFPFATKKESPIRKTVRLEYPPECHQEEEWVRRMEERLCGRVNHFLAWEIAVEKSGPNWRDTYYQLKKSPSMLQDNDYSN